MFLIDEIHDRQYDSTLFNTPSMLGTTDPDVNFDLMLYLKVHLQRRDPPAGRPTHRVRDWDGIARECIRWSDAAWESFCDRYKEQVDGMWNDSFRLITPATYDGLDYPASGPNRRRRNVDCGFRVLLSLGARGAHVSIPVVRLSPTEAAFRSHARLYSDRDLQPDTYTSPTGRVSWSFFTAPHEVGHLLGLGHSNEGARICRENPGADICYGATLEQRMEVMGTGGMLSLNDARPWRRRIARHTRTREADWPVTWQSADAAFRGADQVRLRVD